MAFFVGITGYGLGLILSALLDLPSGGVIIWMMAFICVCVAIVNCRGSKEQVI